MTIQEAMKAHPDMGARQLWESDKDLQKTEYVDFAKQWHELRAAKLKFKPANTTGHDDIDAGTKAAPAKPAAPVEPTPAK